MICESVWVLTAVYSMTRPQIALGIVALLEDHTFAIGESAVLREALNRFQAGKGDLSAYLNCLHAQRQGAKPTYTFDKALHREPGFQKD